MFPGLEKYITSVDVECLSLNDFFKKFNIEYVDIILIDTEGFDYEIIRQIDFNKYMPSIIIFEHIYLSPKSKEKCITLLENNNYKIIIQDGNVLAKKIWN